MTTAHELEVIGTLEVTDEHGETHTVVIRREDLTTTNGAYRAIRDTVADTLSLVLSINRGEEPVPKGPDYPDWSYLEGSKLAIHTDAIGHPDSNPM